MTTPPTTKGVLADAAPHRAIAATGPAAIPALRLTLVAADELRLMRDRDQAEAPYLPQPCNRLLRMEHL